MRISDWSSDVCSSDLITSCRWSASSSASNRATEQASLAESMTRVRTGEAPSVDAVEAVEIRARATLEDARRIAVAEGRDEIALHLRRVGEEGRVDRSIVEARHRPGIETERARREEDRKSTRLNSSH